jgi:DNA-binding Lrp family transcriptional regulator
MSNIDKINSIILRELIKDSRVKLKEVAEKCGITPVAVKKRINTLRKEGIVLKSVLIKNMGFFGYRFPALICINLFSNKQIEEISDKIQESCQVYQIDKTFGEYDLCVHVFAKSIKDLDSVKNNLVKIKQIVSFDINIWNNVKLNYKNVEI